MAALCDRKARSEQPFGEVRIKRCLRARPKSEFTAEKVCSTETHSTGTHSTGTNAAEMNATGTNATEMNAAGTNSAERVAAERVVASCCLAAFRRRSLRTPHSALRTPHKTAARRVRRCGCQNRGGRAIGTACCTSAPLHMSQKAHERNVWLDIAAEIE